MLVNFKRYLSAEQRNEEQFHNNGRRLGEKNMLIKSLSKLQLNESSVKFSCFFLFKCFIQKVREEEIKRKYPSKTLHYKLPNVSGQIRQIQNPYSRNKKLIHLIIQIITKSYFKPKYALLLTCVLQMKLFHYVVLDNPLKLSRLAQCPIEIWDFLTNHDIVSSLVLVAATTISTVIISVYTTQFNKDHNSSFFFIILK